jgi:monoamine oxidase
LNPFPARHWEAFSKLGFGNVLKVLVIAKKPFWNTSITNNAAFLFSEEKISTWWKSEGMVLSGWVGGPSSLSFTKETAYEAALQSLKNMFPSFEPEKHIEEIVCWNWSEDPFTMGAYSYDVPGGKEIKEIILKPLDNKIFFSGEALYKGPMIGTVEAALQTGLDSARQIINGLV